MFLNLCAGLDRLGKPYRVNDYSYLRQNPTELACIIGRPFLLDAVKWKNPILFGAAIYSHPLDDVQLLERLPVKRVLVPGEWMRAMCEPYWGEAVKAWPVGIDTCKWVPAGESEKDLDVLLYDKVLWKYSAQRERLVDPIREVLRKSGRTVVELRYGAYREEEFQAALGRCRAMIFLCEHETQGIAYQQALSCGVPIYAWDPGGPWQDPSYYPDKVVFGPVTSIPYWDDRCGDRFDDFEAFECGWSGFWRRVCDDEFQPRDYILENLTLERCAQRYLDHVADVA